VTKQIILGHSTSKGWFIDSVYNNSSLAAGVDYNLGLTLKGTTIGVTLNGATVLSRTYNAVVTDGGFGLFSRIGQTSFDSVTVKTDDPAVTPPPAALMAAGEPDARGAGVTVAESQIEPIFEEALRRWALAQDEALVDAVRDTDIQVVDLAGDQIGLYENGVIYIDVDAAGNGWFVDYTRRRMRSSYGGTMSLLLPRAAPRMGRWTC
jgi:hypothetical protein